MRLSLPLPSKSAFLLAVCLAIPASAEASSITVGGTNSNNCIPFGCPNVFSVDMYQQVYASTAFSGPVSISALTFTFWDPGTNGTGLATGTYSFSFSTTTAAVNGLSPTFLSNVGISSQAFFSGALPAPGPTSFTISGTPYLYDPSLGNLLLTIGLPGVTDASGFSFLLADTSGTVTSRVWGPSPTGTVDALGLSTEFTVAAVPEPASLVLLGTGLAAAAARRRQVRRRR